MSSQSVIPAIYLSLDNYAANEPFPDLIKGLAQTDGEGLVVMSTTSRYLRDTKTLAKLATISEVHRTLDVCTHTLMYVLDAPAERILANASHPVFSHFPILEIFAQQLWNDSGYTNTISGKTPMEQAKYEPERLATVCNCVQLCL